MTIYAINASKFKELVFSLTPEEAQNSMVLSQESYSEFKGGGLLFRAIRFNGVDYLEYRFKEAPEKYGPWCEDVDFSKLELEE